MDNFLGDSAKGQEKFSLLEKQLKVKGRVWSQALGRIHERERGGVGRERIMYPSHHRETEDFLHLLIKHGGNRVAPEAQCP